MNITKRPLILVACLLIVCLQLGLRADEPKMYRNSTTFEKERPTLNETTRRLISNYRQNPTEENRAALRRQVEKNYDAVVAKKKAKLEELRQTAKDAAKIQEMQDIVDEMLRERTASIDQTMTRFSDPRLVPGARETTDGFLPVLGAAQNVSIAYTPVTNAEYARFLKATGRKAPKDWKDGAFPTGQEHHPVVWVSYQDALAYCQWLTQQAGAQLRYRLPTEQEWELAAGHMPKDADFNCGVHQGTTPVDAYKNTLSACGSIDMWGNCWEWTSTEIVAQTGAEKGQKVQEIKGGSWYSQRTSCRTETRTEGRRPDFGYATVGFRIVRETLPAAPQSPK